MSLHSGSTTSKSSGSEFFEKRKGHLLDFLDESSSGKSDTQSGPTTRDPCTPNSSERQRRESQEGAPNSLAAAESSSSGPEATQALRSEELCVLFGSMVGCVQGDRCPYVHSISEPKLARTARPQKKEREDSKCAIRRLLQYQSGKERHIQIPRGVAGRGAKKSICMECCALADGGSLWRPGTRRARCAALTGPSPRGRRADPGQFRGVCATATAEKQAQICYRTSYTISPYLFCRSPDLVFSCMWNSRFEASEICLAQSPAASCGW